MNESLDQFAKAARLEREADLLAPRVRQGFAQVEGPSERVLQAIRSEARRRATRNRFLFSPQFKILWAAAAVALLLGGGALRYQYARVGVQEDTLRVVLNLGSPGHAGKPAEGTAELASQLLNIQGLDAEAFFTSDETEALLL